MINRGIRLKKDCFGILNKVFPMGEDGLRYVPNSCFECLDRVECLKQALNTPDGIEMREELLSRTEQGGIIGWIRRWSQLKELNRIKQNIKK